MSTLYTTLWMITQAYAAPLGYYGSIDACQTVANGLAVPQTAQVLCVPSDTAMPLEYRTPPQSAESQQGGAAPTIAANWTNLSLHAPLGMQGQRFSARFICGEHSYSILLKNFIRIH